MTMESTSANLRNHFESRPDSTKNERRHSHQIAPVVLLILQLGCVVVAVPLLISSLSHFANNIQFYRSILEYRLIGPEQAKWAAAVLPGTQLVLGIWLLLGIHREIAAAFSGVLLSLFVLAQVSVMIRGMKIPCGCFGANEKSVSIETIWLPLILAIISSTIWTAYYFRWHPKVNARVIS